MGMCEGVRDGRVVGVREGESEGVGGFREGFVCSLHTVHQMKDTDKNQ